MIKLFSFVLSLILITTNGYAYNNNSWVVQPKSYNQQNSNNSKCGTTIRIFNDKEINFLEKMTVTTYTEVETALGLS